MSSVSGTLETMDLQLPSSYHTQYTLKEGFVDFNVVISTLKGIILL